MKSSGMAKSVVLLVLFSSVMIFLSTAELHAKEDNFTWNRDYVVNAGYDNGYSEENIIGKDDPHWNWQLGEFYVSGYTRKIEDKDGEPIFLKNVGDKVTLWFSLEQDIDNLDGKNSLAISEDPNGWDEKLGVAQQNFGKGMLIVKHRDYLNNTVIKEYQNFLSANATTTANTKVEVFEEGDYEVALDYEVKRPRVNLFGWKPNSAYFNYRMSFKFSVRNGNTMVFPFDVKTKAELKNSKITENGFYLDLAKSRYLDIDIKKEILEEGADGLVEDTRFNKPAKDGTQYTEEGIYTITVSNRYTDRETTKKIYVGNNSVLKAYIVNDVPIEEIQKQLALGAKIEEDGTLIQVEPVSLKADELSNTTHESEKEVVVKDREKTESEKNKDVIEETNTLEATEGNSQNLKKDNQSNYIMPLVLSLSLIVAATSMLVGYKKGRNSKVEVEDEREKIVEDEFEKGGEQ